MKLDRELIYKKYMERIDSILEENDWKSSFSARECVNIVCSVIENME